MRAAQNRRTERGRQRSRLLDPGDNRHQHEEMRAAHREVSSQGSTNSTRIEPNIMHTPSSLFGTERRIA
jgi:hypothetical protein